MAANKTIIVFKPTQTANGTGLPGAAEVVTLFDSTVTFNGTHTLQGNDDQYWFTYAIAPSTNATGNSVTGEWSMDGTNWNVFYTSSTNEPVGDSTTFMDEVFIGPFRNVRFKFNNGALAQATKFDVAMSLDARERGTAGI